MSYVNNFNRFLSLHPNLLTIRTKTSFGKTFKKIKKSNNTQFVLLEKPKINQMSAVILAKVLGKKFFWVQQFDNPPIPNFITRLLLFQADKIIVGSRGLYNQLKSYGISKAKIKIQNNT